MTGRTAALADAARMLNVCGNWAVGLGRPLGHGMCFLSVDSYTWGSQMGITMCVIRVVNGRPQNRPQDQMASNEQSQWRQDHEGQALPQPQPLGCGSIAMKNTVCEHLKSRDVHSLLSQ